MSRYILFFFSLIFVFSNKVQTTDYMGTLDTSSGYCDLKDFGLGKVKVGEEKYDYRNCQVARCEKEGTILTDVWNCQTMTRIAVTYTRKLGLISSTLTAVLESYVKRKNFMNYLMSFSVL
nr:Tx-1032 [Heteropoda pingtungensis]